MKWSMCVWETNASVARSSRVGLNAELSPRSNRSARLAQRISTYRPGSPNGGLTGKGENGGFMGGFFGRWGCWAEDPHGLGGGGGWGGRRLAPRRRLARQGRPDGSSGG